MKFLPYLLKKDLIRLKYLLLVWLLLILAQSALGIGGHNLAAEYLEFQMLLPLLAKLISFLQGLMVIVIVPLIIQDDSIVGTTAFWFTRPIPRKGLLFTKSCLVLILLAIPPLIAEIFVLSAHGATIYYLLLAVPEIFIEKLAFIIPFVILAALTPKFSRYALVGIIIFAVFTVITITSSVITIFLPNLRTYLSNVKIHKNPSLAASLDVAKDIYVILIGSVLIVRQFLTRSTAKTIKWLVVAFLVMICLTRIWNWDFLKEISIAKSPATISDSLSVDFDTQYLTISDEVRFRKKDVRGKSISIKQTVKGLPSGQFAILRKMKDVQMKYPDGTILESKHVSAFKRELFSGEKFMLSIQAALGDVKLLSSSIIREAFSGTEIFSLDESDFHQFKNKTGAYSAQVDFDIYEYKIVSQLPLKQGAKDTFGTEQIVIQDILEKPNAISVILSEKKTYLLFDRSVKKKSRYDVAQNIYSQYNNVYLIVNKNRREALLAKPGGLYINVMAAYGPTRLETMAKQLDFTNLNDRSEPQIDKEWLANAELVRLDAVKVSTAKINITIEDFSLPSQSTITNKEFDELDQQLRMQDKRMKEMYSE